MQSTKQSVVIFLSLLVVMSVSSADPMRAAGAEDASVDFLFSEDSKVGQTTEQFKSSFESKALLRGNKWLNAPLTRLDYVLLNIQTKLNASLPEIVQLHIKDNFERTDSYGKLGYLPSPGVEFFARYSEQDGRLALIAAIDNLGKPKKPMKGFCETVLANIERSYPLSPIGYAWHNNALGLLMRNDSDNTAETNTLAASAVIMVRMTATYMVGQKNTLFGFGCRKQSADGPVTFYKYAMPLRSAS